MLAEGVQQERNAYSKSMGKLMGEAKAKGEDVEPLKQKGEQLKMNRPRQMRHWRPFRSN